MKINLKNTTLWVYVLVAFALTIPLSIWADREPMYEIADALLCGAAVSTFIGTAPATYNTLKLPPHTLMAHEYLIAGTDFVALFGSLRFFGQWYWRASERPEWWISSPWLLITTFGMAIGFFMMMLSMSAENDIMRSMAYVRTSLLFAMSGGVAGIMIWAGWG